MSRSRRLFRYISVSFVDAAFPAFSSRAAQRCRARRAATTFQAYAGASDTPRSAFLGNESIVEISRAALRHHFTAWASRFSVNDYAQAMMLYFSSARYRERSFNGGRRHMGAPPHFAARHAIHHAARHYMADATRRAASAYRACALGR